MPDRQIIQLTGGERLAYLQAGEGHDVLLIHGMLTTSHEMKLALFDALAAKYRVTAVDRPGHGLSTRKRVAASPQSQARTIMQGARAMGLRRPIVVGHSLGATVAIHIALAFPDEVAGVVAIAPLAFPEPRLETLLFGLRGLPGLGDAAASFNHVGPDVSLLPMLWRAMFLPQTMAPSFRDNFPFEEVSRGESMRATGEDSLETPLALTDSVFRYGACQTPISLVTGSADAVVNPLLHAVPLSKMLGRSKVEIVNGMGHMLHHFKPEIITREVDELALAH